MNNISIAVDIYFRDLKPEAQKNILDAFGIKSETEANWDVFPMTLVEGEIIRKDEVEC